MRITFTIDSPQGAQDVLLECDDATPAADVERLVLATTGDTGDLAVPTKVTDDAPAPTSLQKAVVATLGLREGVRVRVGDTAARCETPSQTGLQLHVVGGPDAGQVFSLPVGSHDLGRSGTPSWADHSLSRRHCRIEVGADKATVVDLGSSNGTRVDGEVVGTEDPVELTPGALLEIGDSLVELRPARGRDATVEAGEPGWINFLRPPRIAPWHLGPSVEVPKAPKERESRKFPVVAMIVPLVFGVAMALVLKRPTFLMFALMSPIMLGANFIQDRRGSAREHKQAVADYEEALAKAQQELDDAVESEQQRFRAEMPDPADTFLTCVLPGKRLWERRRHDPDLLALRLGSADLPSTVTVTGAEDGKDHELHQVPTGVWLTKSRIVGLAGPDEVVDGLLRWVMAQMAAYHAPRDLSLSFLTTRGGEEWSWLRWLPHLRGDDPDGALAMVCHDDETRQAGIAGLASMVKQRQEAASEAGSKVTAESFPAHVVVLHGYRAMREVQGLGTLLEDGPSVAVYFVCVEDTERSLPERCTATLVVDPQNPSFATLRRSGEAPITDLLLDRVSPSWCEQAARELAPLRDVGASQEGGSLPESARLLDVMRMDPPTSEGVRARWTMEPRSTTMTIGVGIEGPFSLDLKSDGPHGLVAGMTGSGKTELLQTIIASLALANRPEWLNFVLIDYKGDSAFKDCVNLPHTVGKVNDLDPYLVERALASLEAELDVRKNILAEAAVKDIEDYQDLYDREPYRDPLPRLVLVIDEFAELAKELPDFMAGLVSIAAVGRSLGVHLLLATQRPSGVVSPAIRANTNMRIALRVADTSDSTDVINSPDSARIPKSAPGRGHARLGAGALLSFQSGRVGGRRPGAVSVDLPPPFIAPLTWQAIGYAAPRPQRGGGSADQDVSDTDLAALVQAVREAATIEEVPAQRQPWLQPIDTRIQWSDFVEEKAVRGVVPSLPFARVDLPAKQQQETHGFDLDRDGHLYVVGSARSGRSQVLRTLAASIGALADPSDVHLYGIDCGSGALNALIALPHVGAVVSRSEGERAARLMNRLTQILDERQRLLAENAFADIKEQRASGADPLPHVVVMIDRWEGFTSTLGEVDSISDAVLRVLREGASVGVHMVITGDRTLISTSRMSTLTENKLGLRMADKGDWTFLSIPAKGVPDKLPPGRGFLPGVVETQVMLLAPEDSGKAQADVIARIGREARERLDDSTVKPFRVDVLPSRLTLEQGLAMVPADSPQPYCLFGVGGDELTTFGLHVGAETAFIVAGPGKSGRTSVLLGAARSTLATGGTVLAIAPRAGGLRDLEGTAGVLAVFHDGSATEEEVEALVSGADAPVLVVIDDGEGLRDAACGPFLAKIVKGQVPDCTLVLGGNADGVGAGLSGWQVEAKKARQGLLLSPQGISDGDLIGIRVPRNLIGGPVQPGRGLLNLGAGSLMQVATLLS
ncbi:FtsK/SpoIIIE domain-containing protein [Nocardioides acrostichi]|uniref:FHA domain-containing protein n=1 Tax=Nocardioides acrostichi TaxID=2784339 RepID=A0A930YBA3_9ACTN|nr:FtsK/SpoIIIE domain-containing protein [Nocardioides acrostichi]MBF4160284.1 FHA domain-containing protein [Nocardioides acrostichi]